MTFRVHHRARTESTNLDARAGRSGDVFTADEQTAGRGRLDHRWLAEPGANLLLSAVLDVAGLAPGEVATLPLAVGLAVRDAVADLLPGRVVALKWPNDVLVEGRKIAGILCERRDDCVVAGVGLNVGQTTFPAELAGRATSLACEGVAESVAATRDRLLARLGSVYETWRRDGFASLLPRWAAVDALRGRRVVVRQTDDDAHPLAGVCGGVQADGTLLVDGVAVCAGEAHVMDIS